MHELIAFLFGMSIVVVGIYGWWNHRRFGLLKKAVLELSQHIERQSRQVDQNYSRVSLVANGLVRAREDISDLNAFNSSLGVVLQDADRLTAIRAGIERSRGRRLGRSPAPLQEAPVGGEQEARVGEVEETRGADLPDIPAEKAPTRWEILRANIEKL